MKNLINTKKVKASKSLSTEKTIVKMFGSKVAEIIDSTIVVTMKLSEINIYSLSVFAERNNLELKF